MIVFRFKYIFLFLLIVPCFLKADYITPKIYNMVFEAEEIIAGEIICVDEELIEIKIEKSLSFKGKHITFQKFKDWTCGTRWTSYEVGQRSLFFLKPVLGKLTPMGGGNEGEFPLIDSNAFIHNESIAIYYYEIDNENEFLYKEYEFWQNPFYGYKIDLSTLLEMIQTLKSCFTIVEWDKYCSISKIVSNLEKSSLTNKFEEHQPLFDWMFQKVKVKSQILQ